MDRMEIELAIATPLHELAGEASMCWEPIPSGVFDANKASAAARRAATAVVAIIEKRNASLVAIERVVDQDDVDDARLGRELVQVLQRHCGARGDSEGAVQTLERIIRERDAAERKFSELDPELVKLVSAEMRKARP